MSIGFPFMCLLRNSSIVVVTSGIVAWHGSKVPVHRKFFSWWKRHKVDKEGNFMFVICAIKKISDNGREKGGRCRRWSGRGLF